MPATDFLHLFNICIYRLFYLLAPVYQKTFSVTNNLVSITKCSSSLISLIDDKYLNYSSNYLTFVFGFYWNRTKN